MVWQRICVEEADLFVLKYQKRMKPIGQGNLFNEGVYFEYGPDENNPWFRVEKINNNKKYYKMKEQTG